MPLNAIQHTQITALNGLKFESIEEQNAWLAHCEERWAAPAHSRPQEAARKGAFVISEADRIVNPPREITQLIGKAQKIGPNRWGRRRIPHETASSATLRSSVKLGPPLAQVWSLRGR